MQQIRRFLATLICLCLLAGAGLASKTQAAGGNHPFTDLPGGNYDKIITTLWEYSIVSGLEPDKFVPAGPVTRAQMAALIIRAMGKSSEAELAKSVPSEFSDVPGSHWASGVITLASRAGIIKGDAGRFYPNDPVNYAQAATMLVRALGYEGEVAGGYPAGYVLKANELGLLKDLQFELYSGVNRAEAAVFLYNAIFGAVDAKTQVTWSQSVFKRATTISMGSLPTYAAPGQQLSLSATALDLVGKPIPDAQIEFRIVEGTGQVSGKTLTVGDGGAIVVEATHGTLKSSATVRPVSALVINPETFQANKGGSVQLSATALSGGQRVPVAAEWKVKQGPATVDTQGMLTVKDYGNILVEATLGSLTAFSSGQAVGKVTIGSRPEALVPGIPFTFAASATDSAGRPIEVPITWSSSGGVIDRTTGRLSTVTGNTVTVKATAAGISDEVIIPVIKTIQITPATATALVGRTVTFSARGLDASGKQYPLEVRWNRGSVAAGIIDNNGVFAGTSAGRTEITAEAGTLRGTASIQVSGEPARLSVVAGSTSIPSGTGASTDITVKLLDQFGNLSPVDDQPIMLTLGDTGRGTLSRTLVLSQKGEAKVTYTTGSSAGTATISAAVPGSTIAGQAVVITAYQPTPSYIQLAASPQPLASGGGVATITATLQDSNNFPAGAPQTIYVTLTASGVGMGGLTGTTITIPAGQSTGSLSFISSGTPGAVQINGTSSYQVRGITLQTSAVGPAAKAKIRPVSGATPVTGLSSLSVQVEVLDAAGVMRANDNATQVQLSVSIPGGPTGGTPAIHTAVASGGVAAFQVPAYVVGTATLTASLTGESAATDTTTAEFIPGVFSSLRLTAQPAAIPADGYSQTQIIAEVVDRSGVALTTINPVVTFRKLVDGGATNALTDLKVQASGGRAVLTVQSTRLASSDTWYATASGLDTQNLAPVSTTATSGNAYTLKVSGSTNFSVGGGQVLVVQVVDQAGQLVTGDSNRLITINHSMPGVSITPQSTTTQGGLATFSISAVQATSGTLTITAAALPVQTIQQAVTFGTSGTSSAGYSLFPSSSVSSARVGTAITVWVRVMDTQGNLVTSDNNRTITATVTSGSATLASNTANTIGGLAMFTLTGVSAGQVNVSLQAPGLPQPTANIAIQITN